MKTKIKNIIVKIFLWLISMIPGHIEAQSSSNSTQDIRDIIAIYFEDYTIDQVEEVILALPKLNQETKKSTGNYALMVWEQELVELINGDYEKVLEDIIANEQDYYRERNNRTYLRGYRFNNTPHFPVERMMGDDFNKALLRYLELNRTKHEMKINFSSLTDSEKSFLVFYLRLSIFYNGKCQDYSQELMGDAARDFMREHSSSIYADIVKKYGSFKAYQSDWKTGVNFSLMGIGVPVKNSPNSNLGSIIDLGHIGFSASYKNFFGEISGGFSGIGIYHSNDIYQDYEVSSGIGGVWDLTFGYNFHSRNDRFTISPFVGIMGYSFAVDVLKPGYDSEVHDYSDFKVDTVTLRNRSTYAGVNIDFNRVLRYRCDGEQLMSRGYQRFQFGVTSSSVPIASTLSESTHLFFRYIRGIESERERRIPNF